MKLLTKEIEHRLEAHPLGSGGSRHPDDTPIIVKFFSPMGAGTWLITEGEKQADGDWLLFGYCCIQEGEWGCVLLSELEAVRLPLGLHIERDMYLTPGTTVGQERQCLGI